MLQFCGKLACAAVKPILSIMRGVDEADSARMEHVRGDRQISHSLEQVVYRNVIVGIEYSHVSTYSGDLQLQAPVFVVDGLARGCFTWYANAIISKLVFLGKVPHRLTLEVAAVELIEHPFGGTPCQAR